MSYAVVGGPSSHVTGDTGWNSNSLYSRLARFRWSKPLDVNTPIGVVLRVKVETDHLFGPSPLHPTPFSFHAHPDENMVNLLSYPIPKH